MLRVHIDDTTTEDEGVIYYNGAPLTGEMVDVDESGDLLSLTTYTNGIMNGPQWENHPNGQRAMEGTCEMGSAVGVWREWYPNGQIQTYKEFDRLGMLVTQNRWNEDGSPA